MMQSHRCPDCGTDLVPMWDVQADPQVAWRCDRCRRLWDPYEPGKYRPVYWPEGDRKIHYGGHIPQVVTPGLTMPEKKIIIARR